MSADSWARCPRCTAEREAELKRLRGTLNDLYGKVPATEYMAAVSRTEKAENDFDIWKDSTEARTFREDYEVYGAEDGEVTFTYSGGCKVCNASARMEHSVVFWDAK